MSQLGRKSIDLRNAKGARGLAESRGFPHRLGSPCSIKQATINSLYMLGIAFALGNSSDLTLAQSCEFCPPTWANDLPPVSGTVNTSLVWNDVLYIGGGFKCGNTADNTAGCPNGTALNGIAKLVYENGIPRWAPMGGGFYEGSYVGTVNAMAVYGGALYAGGAFEQVNAPVYQPGSRSAAGIARWNGAAWEPVHYTGDESGSGPGVYMGDVYALEAAGGVLYVGGDFTRVTFWDVEFERINFVVTGPLAVLTGNGFTALPESLREADLSSGSVRAIISYNGQIVVGGTFLGSEPAAESSITTYLHSIAKLNSNAFEPLGEGVWKDERRICGAVPCPGSVFALAVLETDPTVGPELYVGGNFLYAGGTIRRSIARWSSGLGWRSVGGGGFQGGLDLGETGQAQALGVVNDGNVTTALGAALYVAGQFTRVLPGQADGREPGVAATNIARWDGRCWQALPCAGGEGIGASSSGVATITGLISGNQASIFLGGSFAAGSGHCESAGSGSYHVTRLTIAADADGDGVAEDCDNCPGTSNPRNISTADCSNNGVFGEGASGERIGQQCDGDGDGRGDVCDGCLCGRDDMDTDADGAANACDACADVSFVGQAGHIDGDGDGIGDDCDPDVVAPMRIVSIEDLNGIKRDVFEYDGVNGRLARHCEGTSCAAGAHILETTYSYGGSGQLTSVTQIPKDGTASSRTHDVFYDDDPDLPFRVIGTSSQTPCCGSSAKFVYRDRLGRVTRITGGASDPASAVTLEDFVYEEAPGDLDGCGGYLGDINHDGVVDGRLREHRRRNAEGALGVVEARTYVGGPLDPYSVWICCPSNERTGNGSATYEIVHETHEVGGRLASREEFDDRVMSCADRPTNGHVTRFEYVSAVDPSVGDTMYEERATVYPGGYADVESRRRTWWPDEWVVEAYRVAAYPEPAGSERINHRTERYELSYNLLDYRLASTTEPGGAVVTYTYDELAHPARVLRMTRNGNSVLTGNQATATTFTYDNGSGRLTYETADYGAAPNLTTVRTAFSYDGYGRLTAQTRNVDGATADQRVTEYRYNAFDEQTIAARRLTASPSPTYSVEARVYDDLGRVGHEYSALHAGSLSTFGDPATAGRLVLRHQLFEYNEQTGQLERDRVVRTDTIPFPFHLTESATATSDTVTTYDGLGQWVLSVARPGLAATQYRYDDQGRRTMTISATGVATRAVYSGRGLVEQSIVQNSPLSPTEWLTTTTSYAPDGHEEVVSEPSGAHTVYGYDAFGRRTEQFRCDALDCAGAIKYETHSEYDNSGNVVRTYVVDGSLGATAPNVSDTVTDYDQFDRAYRVRRRAAMGINDDTKDEVTLTEFNAMGMAHRIAHKANIDAATMVETVDAVTIHDYNELGELKTITRVNVDGLGQRVEEKEQRGYDVAGRLAYEERCSAAYVNGECPGSGKLRKDHSYDALDRLDTVIDEEGHYVKNAYDSRGNLIRRTQFEETNAGERDGAGGLALGQARWYYDAAGRLVKTAIMSDPAADPSVAPSTLDRVTDFNHDHDDRLTWRVTYAWLASNSPNTSETTLFIYDGLWRLYYQQDPTGVYESIYLGADNRGLVQWRSVFDGLGETGHQRREFGYDGLGRVVSERVGPEPSDFEQPMQATSVLETRYTLDALDRQISLKRQKHVEASQPTQYVMTSFTYDLLGRRSTVTEAAETPVARTVASLSDRLGRLTEVRAVDDSPAPATTQTTQYGYDLFGRRTWVRYPNASDSDDKVTFQYDRAGRLEQSIDRSDRTIQFQRDGRGLLSNRTYCGATCDAAASPVVDTLGYDGMGRLTSATRVYDRSPADFISAVTRRYDAFSNVTSETQAIGTATPVTFSYEFGRNGNRKCTDCGGAAARIDYTYDELDRVSTLSRNGTPLASYEYCLDSTCGGFYIPGTYPRKRTVYLGGGRSVQSQFEYDDHRRLNVIATSLVTPAGTQNIATFNSAFDDLGNRRTSQVNSATLFAEAATFEYDDLDRLTLADYTGPPTSVGDESFDLDSLGNREAYANTRAGTPTLVYGPNDSANRYSTINGLSVEHDADGNLTRSAAGHTLTYDHEHRLVQVDSALMHFDYDALGRRIVSKLATGTTYHYYDGQRIVAENEGTTAAATPARYFVDGPLYVDEHLLLHENDRDYAYLLGPLYSVMGLVDDTGVVMESYHYDAYGAPAELPASGQASAAGSRYLSITPPNYGSTRFAIHVQGDASDPETSCVDLYARKVCEMGSQHGQSCATDADCPKTCEGGTRVDQTCSSNSDCPPSGTWACFGACTGRELEDGPVYLASAEWGVVTVGHGQIHPSTEYDVSFVFEGSGATSPIAMTTRKWADVDGNGSVNVLDICSEFGATTSIGYSNGPQEQNSHCRRAGTVPPAPAVQHRRGPHCTKRMTIHAVVRITGVKRYDYES